MIEQKDIDKVVKNMKRSRDKKMFIYGDYVVSACKNAFNDKESYWLSKRGYMKSIYCFTPICADDLTKTSVARYLLCLIPSFENNFK